tara:strand:- start:552 stop:695 length:144 start_codon:yes stop_codon:yes gene_type:complete
MSSHCLDGDASLSGFDCLDKDGKTMLDYADLGLLFGLSLSIDVIDSI